MGWDNLKFSGPPKNNAKVFKAPHPPPPQKKKKESFLYQIKSRKAKPN